MFDILLNWIYVLIIMLILGWSIANIISKYLHYDFFSLDYYILLGIISTITYAQIFSLFYRVSLLANCILLATCLICIIVQWKQFSLLLKCIPDKIKTQYTIHFSSFIFKVLIIFTFLIFFLFVTSRGAEHYDTQLYHAQSIRWIEEYGIVKGLANLHCRFAYNSSFFCLSALFSMKFLTGQSLHTLSGLFALLASLYAILSMSGNLRKDIPKLGILFYSISICSGLMSPATDYPVTYLILYIYSKWITLLEDQENSDVPYAILSIAILCAITIKLSSFFVILLVIKPMITLLKDKQWKKILLYVCIGLLVIIPFLARNVILCGWLVYPYSAIDLFHFDWKVPAQVLDLDVQGIVLWGRALYDYSLLDAPLTYWVPIWIKAQSTGDVVLFIIDIFSVLFVFFISIINLFKKQKLQYDYLLIILSLCGSLLLWFFGGPVFRYSYAYSIMLPLCACSFIITKNTYLKKQNFSMITIVGLIILCFFNKNIISMKDRLQEPYYIHQQDYENILCLTFTVNDYTFFYPQDGDRTGYYNFPGAPIMNKQVELRGSSLSNGFRYKE